MEPSLQKKNQVVQWRVHYIQKESGNAMELHFHGYKMEVLILQIKGLLAFGSCKNFVVALISDARATKNTTISLCIIGHQLDLGVTGTAIIWCRNARACLPRRAKTKTKGNYIAGLDPFVYRNVISLPPFVYRV